MIKLVFVLRRLPHLTREEFQRYWRELHGPLVASHAKTLRIRRYVQVHTLPEAMHEGLRQRNGAGEEYDGVAELWWDSFEDLAAGNSTEEGRRAGRELLEDERRFVDLPRSPMWLANEHEVVG